MAGTWQATQPCVSCSTLTGAPVCNGATKVPDGGSMNTCTSANCTGCCASNGVCIANRNAAACGTNGAACVACESGKMCDATFQCVTATGCGAVNCGDGCCANGACIRPPNSPTDHACGPSGGACTDCTALALVCNPALRSCQTTSTGGAVDAGEACNGVPVAGKCLSSTVVQFCAVSTGQGANTVKTYACNGSSTCQPNAAGASCVAAGNSCKPTDTRCVSGKLETCTDRGAWGTGSSCGTGTCKTGTVGSFCAPALATVSLTATLKYEARLPVVERGFFHPDWGPPTSVPARNVVVYTSIGSGASAQLLDQTATDINGQYTVKVPASPASGDALVFVAMGGDVLGVRFAVADPGFSMPSGEYEPGQTITDGRIWSWVKTPNASGGTTTITTAQGSGALNVFDQLQSVYLANQRLHQGKPGADVVVWLGLGTTWSCGMCFLDLPGYGFESQVYVGADSVDQAYWGDAVVAHELGHWSMASYGLSGTEGGTHYAGIKTFPGQAYSEGFSTFHSATMRGESVYYDHQNGGMFWFDLASRQYFPSTNVAFGMARAVADAGMLQLLDENDVASMLWQVARVAPAGEGQLHNALASQHMNVSPWPGGYTRHLWEVDAQGTKKNIVDTHQSTPHLGDLLDALRCSGMPAATIDSATNPATEYPFRNPAPTCRAGFCYGCLSGTQCLAGSSPSACGSGGVTCSVCTGPCTNGVCQ